MDSLDLLMEDDAQMDELFREAFESLEMCRERVDKMRPGASVSSPILAAEIMHGDWCAREMGAVRKGSLGIGFTRSSPILYIYL